MKLNINQWNTVLEILKEKEQVKKGALELLDRLIKEAESDRKSAETAEDWDTYDKAKAAVIDLEKTRRSKAQDLRNLHNIICDLENQEL